MKISIILPTYNEKDNLKNLADKIFSLNIPNLNLVVIDDNSPDGTAKIASELAQKYNIEVICRPRKMGLGSAYRLGFKKALDSGSDLIFGMDGDLSHNPNEIPNFIKAAQDGYDLIIGSRRIKGGEIIGWNNWRKFCSQSATEISRLFLGIKAKDATSGFRCYTRQILEKIPFEKIRSNGYSWLEEILLLCQKNQARIHEIPITFLNRTKGKSKLGWREILEFFRTLIRLKFEK